MDPTQLQPSDALGVSAPSAPLAGPNPQAGNFQAVFRETLEAPPAGRGVDMATDVRNTVQSIMGLEGYMNSERIRLFQALVPDVALGSGAGATGGQSLRLGGGNGMGGTGMDGGGGAGRSAYSDALSRDSDRISMGTRPLYSDTPSNTQKGIMAPLMQSAFGLPGGTDPNAIDFASQIEQLDNRSMSLMERIANVQRSSTGEASMQENMRQFGEITALNQEFSSVTTSKAVVAQIYIGVYEEARNKAMTAIQLIQSSFSKLNQVFSQLKSGS